MIERVIGFFLSKDIVSKLGWLSSIGKRCKVHSLPLVLGSISSASLYTLGDETKFDSLSCLIANQTILDGLCASYKVCDLNVSMGLMSICSILLGVTVAFISDRLYMAESPKFQFLKEANEKAEAGINFVEKVTGNDIPTAEDDNG